MTLMLLLDNLKLFDVELYSNKGFIELVIRFFFNLAVLLIIVRGIYYPSARRKDYLFTYILISITIFILCFLLDNVKMQIGFALGLFAIFGIIRYRTNPIPIKEMTYLFLIIGMAVINALSNKKISYAELLFANLAIISVLFILERLWLLRHESCKMVLYERIELIKPDKLPELIADLSTRTGLKINRVEIGKIDFLRDSARLNIYYYDDEINSADENVRNDNGDDD